MPNQRLDVFKYAEKLNFGELHFKIDPNTGLFAIVAIHNTKRGPALGGCRWINYANTREAIYDALRLARGMSFKAALSNLAHGGGKSVIIRPQTPIDRERYFAAFGAFLNELGGNYITAVDSGTSPQEMDIIAKYSTYVTSTSAIGNPAIYTAQGVLRGMEAAIKVKFDKDSLAGLHIAIQGVGQVGYLLARECYRRGAKLTVADTDPRLVQRCATEFAAAIAEPENIHTVACDIFSPCALGGILNHHTIAKIHCSIIAGSANNQLSEPHDGHLLHRLGILYAPDYIINAGGLIQASGKYYGASDHDIEMKINTIYDTLLTIFTRSQSTRRPPSDIADALALERLTQESESWQK